MRIAIIGAGPAGLAAAVRLRDRGYQDVTVFERADRVGGKVFSVEIDGAHYDLGAVLVSPGYLRTLALAKRYGVPLSPRLGRRAVVDLTTGRWMDIIEALASRHSAHEYMAAITRAYRYINRYRKFFDTPGFAFTGCPQLEDLRQDIAAPLAQWAHAKKLEPLLTMWEPTVADMGYGPDSTVPAQYALMHMLGRPRVTARHQLWRMTRKRGMPLLSFKRGYQSLFDAVARDHDVRTGVAIERIVRRKDSVSIHRVGRAAQRFDKVMLAMPLDAAVDLIEDEAPDNPPGATSVPGADIFKSLQHTDYYATVAESPRLLDRADMHFALGSQNLGLAGGHSSQASPDAKLRVFYHYGDPEDPGNRDAAADRLRQDLARVGLPLRSVQLTQQWRYFPRLSGDHVARGSYDEIDRLQGRMNTYFLGSALAFESVERTIGYSYGLVDRAFPMADG